MFLLCLLSFISKAQKPVAGFYSNIKEGCAPLLVQFIDSSKNNPTSWIWDLGNGVTSTQQNPLTTYLNAGTYTVQLIAINSNGRDTITQTNYIIVHDKPTINFSASKTTGCFPLNVQFTDASNANSGTITNWTWDFGDGNTSTQQNPQHTYSVAGSFTVTLQVKNSKGCTSILNKPNYINITDGTKANFNVSASSCTLPVNINFTNTSTGSGALNYQWNFGDGNTSTQPSPTHTYTSNGSYTVTLIATNNAGCKDTLIKANAVTVGTVNADFNFAGTSTCQNTVINFTNTSLPTTTNVVWDFGDGTTSTQSNPQKVYISSGNYNVKLVANFGSCKDSITKIITITPKPTAHFTYTPVSSCLAPLTVNFVPVNSAFSAYQWNFGDGTTSTQPNPTHTFTSNGSYTVTLITTNSDGCKDTLVKTNAVVITPPTINSIYGGAPYSGCAPYTNSYQAYITTSDTVVTYQWDFGDGTPVASGSNPTHTYLNTGFYTIKLIITTLHGCTDTLIAPQIIKLYEKPHANFSAFPLNGCAKDSINFTDLSTGTITSFNWSFGDGGFSFFQNPTYFYTDTGWFTVRLIVSNNNCKDTFKINKYIYINPPIAKFEYTLDCDTPLLRKFIDKSIGAVTYLWDFGDGTTSTDPSPQHIFPGIGTYNVKLTVTNGACVHENTQLISIAFVNPVLTVNGNEHCKYANVTYNVTNILPAYVNYYEWNFGDGTSSAGGNLQSVTHQYIKSGNVSPFVVIVDGLGCVDTLKLQIPVSIYGPKAGFTNPAGTCINGTINFADTSLTDGIHNITQRIWDNGDGGLDTLTTPAYAHQYNNTGFYTVKLKVVDNYGCYDTIVKPNAVLITKPVASFTVSDTIKCANNNIQFNNTSQGVNLTYVWSFGDNLSSTQKNPQHAYSTQGFYDVKLKIKDIFNCTDSIVKPSLVHISNPVASFNFIQGDTLGLCYPYTIQVANSSTSITSINWSFGDGGFSNVNTPSHIYNYVGSYKLTLKAFGYGGCVDSVSKNIIVRGPTGTFSYSPLQFCSPTVVNFTAHTKNNASFVWDFADGVVILSADSVVSHTYKTAGIFKPAIIMIDSAGCQIPIAGIDTVKVADVTTFIKLPQTQFCDSVQLNLLDSSIAINDTITQYHWNFGDGNFSTLKNPKHFYNHTGNYTVSIKVTTSLGCTNTDTLQVPLQVVQTPKIAITGDSSACVVTPLNYTGTILKNDTLPLSWHWSLANGNTSTLQNPLPQQYNTAGTYNIKAIVSNAVGCADTVQKNIIIHPLPNTYAGLDSFVCRGSFITLHATGANTYQWYADTSLSCLTCASPHANPTTDKVFKVIGISSFGCIKEDSVFIKVQQPFSLAISPNDTLCIGESAQLKAFSDGDIFNWQPTTGLNNPTIANPIATPTTTTVYSVIVNDLKNCFKDTATVEIKVYPIPQFNIVESIIQANVGAQIPLVTTNSTDITKWNWFPKQWLSCYDCPTPTASITDKIKYIAEASNPGGCSTRDEITIEPLCNGYNVFIPNTFSPNGDGANDVFYPRGNGLFTIRSMTVFNRWGEIVFSKRNFSANNASEGWNGTFNGKQLSADVYVYSIEVVCINNESMFLKGNIMLLR